METGVFSFIDDFFPANNLIKGKDFEVVSYMVMDEETELYSADYYYNVDTSKLLNEFNIKQIIQHFYQHSKMQNEIDFMETPYPDNEIRNIYFYNMRGSVHFDYAISLGLGVVKMLKGEHQDDYYLYNFSSFVDDEANLHEAIMEEILKLKMYVQLTNPAEVDDKKLEKLLMNNPVYFSTLIPGTPSRILNDLLSIYKLKKGKVMPFSRG